MTLITIPGLKKTPDFNKDRRPPDVVLGTVNPGASARGNTYWKTARGCPREHALRNIVRYKKEGDQEALTQGLIFHYALEVYYRGIQAWQHALGTTAERPDIVSPEYVWGGIPSAEAAAWKALEPLSREAGYGPVVDSKGKHHEGTYAEVERMLASYFDCYRRQDRWRVVAVEETLEYEDAGGQFGTPGFHAPPMEYSARLDLIVEDYDRGGLWVIEHKTARALTDDLLEGYQMDQQIVGQVWLLRNCVDLSKYPTLRGVTINLTSKTKVPKHQRVDVNPSKRHVAAFEESIRAWNGVLPAFEKYGWPKALGNCSGPMHYFKKCEFFDVCHGWPDVSVAQFMRYAEPPLGYVRREDR